MVKDKMPRLNPLRKLYVSLNSKLKPAEVNTLKDLLVPDQIQTNEVDQLDNATKIFSKLEEKGHISLGNLELLKELFLEIQRSPLVEEVDKFLRENRRSRPESQLADTTSSIQITDAQHSGHGDVTASSERSTAAVHREMARAMQDSDGETTSVQHHIDNHNIRRALYEQTVQKEQRLQEQGVQEQVPDSAGIVEECEKRLKFYYSNLSHILPFPWWDGTNRLKLENVYTELELQTKEGTKEGTEKETKEEIKRDFPTREIFSPKHDRDSHMNPKRVLIEGDPGYGKSTFCKKLAYDWAEGNVEYLSCFKLLFCFELKDMLECDRRNVRDAIFDYLSWEIREDEKRQELWHFIQDNQTKVCFVFDGLDEVQTKNLPEYFKEMVRLTRRFLPYCPVIVTSRKIRDSNSKQMYDTQLLIKGFGIERAKAFVERHIKETDAKGEHLAEVNSSHFMKEVEMSSHKHILFNFMQSPLNTLMLYDIWIHEKKLPHTITELYEEIINYIKRRYKENNECTAHFDMEINQALLSLGELSYTSLKKFDGNNYFSEKDISRIRYIRELGLLTKLSESPAKYGFYHLTFKEYFAAMYVTDLVTRDRSKFVDAIDFFSNTSLHYNGTLFAFIGGRLRDNVVEIFKVWEERHFSSYSSFDPRSILYESCCRSTEVFEHCAQFLPWTLIVDFNTMASQSDSNRLDVNTTVLQCSNSSSDEVHFILSASNVDTIDMYKKCYDSLQNNPKTFDIKVEIHLDLNEYQTKRRYYVQNFTFLEKAKNDFLQDLKQVTVKHITMKISNYENSSNPYIDNIVQSIFRLSIKELTIEGLPLQNFTFISNVHSYLYNINLLKSVDMTFCDDSLESCQIGKLEITTNFGKLKTCFKINDKNFDILGLCNFLSEFASAYNERVSLDIVITSDCTDTSDITVLLQRCESVHIGHILLNFEQSGSLSKKDICSDITSIVEALSLVSANKLVMKGLPYGNLDFVREVHTVLQSNKLLKSVDMTFCDDSLKYWQTGKLEITANFGKFKTCYKINDKNFDILCLYNFLSEFASAKNERVSLDFNIKSDGTDTSVITVLLQSLESVRIGRILLTFEQSDSLSEKDICSNTSTIVEALSLVSANELVMKGLPPHGNLDFVIEVYTVLQSNKLLQSVDMTFCDDSLEYWQTDKLEITANFGLFKTCYKINDKNFDIIGLCNILSEFASANNERVSLDIHIKSDCTDTLDITVLLQRLESVHIGRILLNFHQTASLSKKDICSNISSIVEALSLVSANKLVMKGLPHGNLDFVREVHTVFQSNKLLKFVDMTFCDDSREYWQKGIQLEITVNFGKFKTCLNINDKNFDVLGLCKFLSEFASANNERVSQTHSLVMKGLPYRNLDFVREVHTGNVLQSNKLLKSVDMTFSDDSLEYWQTDKLKITAHFEKFETCYNINDKNFDILGLYDFLSEFASAKNERVSLDIEIHCDSTDTSDITVLLQRRKLVHIGCMLVTFEQSGSLSQKDICSNILNTVEALSLVSANELVMVGLPHGNFDFVREVHTVLQSNKLLKSVDMIFHDDSLESWKLEITANFGKFKTCYKISDQNFDILGLQTVLTELASSSNERVSLNIEINCNVAKSLVNYHIREMLPSLKSFNIGEIVLTMFNLHVADTDTLKQVPTIVQILSQVSANKLFIRGLPQGSLQSLKDATKCLSDCSSIKSVEMIFCNGEMNVMEGDEEYFHRFFSIRKLTGVKNKIIIKCQRFTIIISKYECSDVNILLIHNLLSKYAATSDEKVTVEVSTEVDVGKTIVESYINDTLAMITSVFVDKMTLLVSNYKKYDEKDICEVISSVVNRLPKHSISKLVIKGLPLLEHLKFMKDAHCCLADDNLLKSVEFTFLDGLELDREGKLEVIGKFGKFKTCYKMNSMNFNIMSLHQSLAEFVCLDNGSITMVIQVNCDFEESTGKDIEGVLAKSGSVDIEKVILHIRNNGSLNTEQVRSCTSDIIQSLSQVSAKEFVIQGLPSEDFELIKTAHSVKSAPNNITHMSFEPLCFRNCTLTPSEHSTIVVKSPKHTSEFGLCQSKFDIISLYQELQKNLSTVKERTVIDANIKSTSNIKDDIEYVLANSKDIMFHNVEYVGTSHEPLPAIDVLESLAEVNTQQFAYKSNKSLQCNFMKSVCNAMLQCQSAQTVVISSTERCEDIEIPVNIEKLVSDGLIIHGVKFKDKTAIIQGSYAEGEKTASKTIEVEFALNHTSNIDLSYDDVEVNHAILDDSNALTKIYIKVCSALKTHKTSELKSLCIELPDIFLDEFCTCYSREFLIENVKACIIALPCLAKVTIVGGKIISTDNSSETWTDLFTKESLEMLEFKDCDLNDSCQSAIIDSVNKADECRCSQLRITLCDSLSSQNVDLMKEKFLTDDFVLSDTAGSALQGDVVFSLKGKYVNIVAISSKETNEVN